MLLNISKLLWKNRIKCTFHNQLKNKSINIWIRLKKLGKERAKFYKTKIIKNKAKMNGATFNNNFNNNKIKLFSPTIKIFTHQIITNISLRQLIKFV
jgi:hypothetical protein